MESVTIPLTQGQVALIDAADAALVAGPKWRATRGRRGTFYARTGPPNAQVWMHRLILGLPPGKVPQVDHVNNDGLDNRRSNLRVATQVENSANSRRRVNNRSGFKGVYAIGTLWGARSGRQYLGMFDTAEEAAQAVDTAARERFGAFANLNAPDDTTVVAARVRVLRRANNSGFFGVALKSARGGRQGGWTARFNYKGRRIFLGLFSTREAAARAWDAKAIELLGPDTRLNFPAD